MLYGYLSIKPRLCFSAWVLCSDIVLMHYCCFAIQRTTCYISTHVLKLQALFIPYLHLQPQILTQRSRSVKTMNALLNFCCCSLFLSLILDFVYYYAVQYMLIEIHFPVLNSLNQFLFWLKAWFSNFLDFKHLFFWTQNETLCGCSFTCICKRMQKHHTCHVSYKKWSILLYQFIICYIWNFCNPQGIFGHFWLKKCFFVVLF